MAADVVAEYDPRAGRATPRFRLVDASTWHEPRVSGRYQPVRSGVLAYYRDGDGRTVIQHRRNTVVAPSDAWRSVSGRVFRKLVIGRNLEEFGRVRVIDAAGRCEGPLLLRLFDFTWTEKADFDLLFAIAHDTHYDDLGTRPLV